MGERRLDSYYFGFVSSGNDDVDAILEAVRDAGKWSHSTEMWADPKDGKDGPTCADNIQTAANRCASVIAEVRSEGFAAGVAAERERIDKAVSALLAKWDANCNRPQKEHSGPSYAAAVGGASATADALAAIRAGEVRG